MSAFAPLARALQSPWAPLWLFVGALVLRIVAALIAGDFTEGVEIWEYGEQALCAAQAERDLCLRDSAGDPYVSALMPPLTSYLWLVLFQTIGITSASYITYVALNVLAGAACAPLLYAFARQIGLDRPTAFFSGGLLAIYPTFVFVSAGYHATNFTVALMLGFAILFLRAAENLHWRAALVAGLVGGLAALTRNELLLVAAAGTLLLLWLGRKQFQRAFVAATMLTLGVGAVMSPWIIRNYVAFERFIPIGAQAGYNVWIGLGPYAQGSGNALDNDPVSRAAAQAVRDSVPLGDAPGDRFEPRLQGAFFADAQPAIAEGGAGRVIRLTAEKFAALVFDWTDPITHSPAYWGPWLVVHALAIYAIVMMWRGQAPTISANGAALIILTLAVLTFAYCISSVFARYRMHLEPFIFTFAAIGAWAIVKRWLRD